MEGATRQEGDKDLQGADSGLWLDSQQENRGSALQPQKVKFFQKCG